MPVIWVHQRLDTLPDIHPGHQFASDADAATMIAQGCAVPGYTDIRLIPRYNPNIKTFVPVAVQAGDGGEGASQDGNS